MAAGVLRLFPALTIIGAFRQLTAFMAWPRTLGMGEWH